MLMMNTFYMVEMDFPFPDERADFDRFYDDHITMLLTVDGFLSAQRFECTHAAVAPLLAIYQVAGPEVLSGPSYRSKGGPSSVSPIYKPRMQNWDRNLMQAADVTLDVPMGGWMVVIDRKTDASPPLPNGYSRLQPVGLDMTVCERGVRIGTSGAPLITPETDDAWVVRVMRPLHPRRTA
jgi:hypothetical protein